MATPTTRHPRPTSNDLLAIIERLTTRTATEPSASVEITRNAKGDVQHSVKVFAPASADPSDVERATAMAYDQATNAFDALNTLHPVGGNAA